MPANPPARDPDAGDVLAGYLAHLGLEAETPSPAGLDRLHRAHVERVPWETVWIHCDEAWGLDALESARRIATTGRAGYCFHLNGAFAWLLERLGYSVTRCVGAVHGASGPSADDFGNHLVLVVADLPTADHPDGRWYVDVGSGDALHHPLPLRPAAAQDAVMRTSLGAATGLGVWTLTHDPRGAFAGLTWEDGAVDLDRFATEHRHLSRDPHSQFVQWLVAFRQTPDAVVRLQGLTLTHVADDPARRAQRVLESEPELFDALADELGIRGIDPAVRGAVWRRAAERHAGRSGA